MFSTPKVANKPPSNAGSKKKDLSLTYEPNSLEEMIGNKEQIKELCDWIEDENDTEERMAIVYAPPGVGKTILLKNLKRKYKTDETNVVDATSLTDEEIGGLIKGRINTKTVVEMFENKPFYKKAIIMIDDIESRISSDKDINNKFKSLIKKGIKLVATANSNMIKKLNKLKYAKIIEFKRVELSELKTFVSKIIRLERKRTNYDFPDYVFSQSNGDVRATLKNLEVLLHKNTRDINMTRDQEFQTLDIVEKLFDKNSGMTMKDISKICTADTFSIIYSLHENYPQRTGTLEDMSKVADHFSDFDYLKSANSELPDSYDIMNGIVGPALTVKYTKKHNRKPALRTYKIISNSNQKVISKNKVTSAIKDMKLSIPISNPEIHDAVKLQAIKDNTVDKYRWFFNRYSDKRRNTSKKNAALAANAKKT
mgnify:CR=1 FL=1|tara:strand:+ start:2840 stop:4114 length:1275 start_codon:yes stop_codon:yes gene_type:complete